MRALFKRKERYSVDSISKTGLEAASDIDRRCFFIQLHKEDINRIKSLASIINEYAAPIARRHYEMICEIPETKLLLETYSYEQKFIAKYENYVKSLGTIVLNEQYVQDRKLIGQVHAKIKLTSDWFIVSYSRLYEVLVPVFIRELGAEKGAAAIVSLQKLLTLDAQIALEAYHEDYEYKILDTNSEIIESIIEIDQVRELLDSVDRSMNASSSISAMTEQLAASVQEIASHAVKVAENSDEMVHSAKKGQQTIHEALNGMMQMTEEIGAVRSKFVALNESVTQMTDVVAFINDVAEQTSLLALNAAIEAARAGEEGRGFAVVASEVRKLSEQTSNSVNQIRSMISTIQSTANDVNGMTEQLEREVTEKGIRTKNAVDQLDLIVTQMAEMGSTTSSIAEIIEGQSAATEDISNRSNELLTHIAIIESNAQQTGKSIYDVSLKVNNLRNETIQYMGHMSNVHTIRIVKTDHLLWRWWAYNSLLGYHTLDAAQAGDSQACRLGQWYDRMCSNEMMSNNEAFKELKAPHQNFHHEVQEMIQSLEHHSRDQALQKLDHIHTASREVVASLDRLHMSLKTKS